MNILYISDYFQPYSVGAANISTYLIARELSKKNNCYVMTQGFQKEAWNYEGLTIYPLLGRYFPDKSLRSILLLELFSTLQLKHVFSFYRTITNFCKEKNIDVINVQSNNLALLVALLLVNKPLVIDVRDYVFTCRFMLKTQKCDKYHLFCLPSNSTKRSMFGEAFATLFFRYQTASYFIGKNLILKPLLKLRRKTYSLAPNSEYVAKSLVNEFGNGNIQVVRNCINESDYTENTTKKPNSILFASSLENSKGVWDCIHAMEYLSDDITLTLAGDGPEKPLIQSYIKEHDIKNIILLGKVKYQMIPKLYQNTYITVQPSVWPEPFGRFILESFASNTPLISTATGGTPEAIKDTETGLLVPVNNPKKLAEAITMLLSKNDLYSKIVKNIQVEIQAYTPEETTKGRMTLYTRLIEAAAHTAQN